MPITVDFPPPLRGHLRVEIVDGTEVVARARPGIARLTSEPGGLVVRMLAADTFELRIPRDAALVRVTADGATLFRFANGVPATPAPAAGVDLWVIPLGPGPAR